MLRNIAAYLVAGAGTLGAVGVIVLLVQDKFDMASVTLLVTTTTVLGMGYLTSKKEKKVDILS